MGDKSEVQVLKKLGEEYDFSLCPLAQLLTGIQLLDAKTSISIC